MSQDLLSSTTAKLALTDKPNQQVKQAQYKLHKRPGHVQQAIAALVMNLKPGNHLTAPEVYRRAQELGLKVSLSAVYRSLHVLASAGNVGTLPSNHGCRYEAKSADEEHDHLICLKCGFTVEFVDELTQGFGKLVAARKGFEHKSSRFDILGVCSNCQIQDEGHKTEQAIQLLEKAICLATEAIPQCKLAIASHQFRKAIKARVHIAEAIEKLNASRDACETSLSLFASDSVTSS